MRVMLSTVGSRGDVQPMLVLGTELARRGHRVCVAAPPNFRTAAAGENLEFLAIGADTARLIHDNKELAEQNPVAALPGQVGLFRRETARQLRDLLSFSDPVDVVVAAGLSLGGRLLAETRKAAYVYISYTLSGIRSREYPPAALPLFGLPRWANAALWATLAGVFDGALGSVIGRERALWGAPPAPPWRSIHGSLTLLAQDEILGAVPRDAVGYAGRVPALVREASAEPLPREIEQFLEAGPRNAPKVYVGFGSMPTVDRQRLLTALRQLTAASGARVLLFSAYGEERGVTTGDGILPVGELSHGALFPRMDLVVHHGGAGTTATVLRAGVPQFIVPHIQDQFFHGRRIHELGLGRAPVAKSKLDAAALITALELSATQRERARAVGRELATESGARPAADFLERLARR
jgi:UDP:flavonoid glycosyltransferase YjiC (YdhE family)